MKISQFLVVMTIAYSALLNSTFAAPGDDVESGKLKAAFVIGKSNGDMPFGVDEVIDSATDNKSYLTRILKDEGTPSQSTLNLGFSTINDSNTNSGEFFRASDWKLARKGNRLVLSASKDKGAKQVLIEFYVRALAPGVPRDPKTNSSLYMKVKMSTMGVENEKTGALVPFTGTQDTHIGSAFELGSLYVNNGVLYQKDGLLTNELTVKQGRDALKKVMEDLVK